MPIQEEDRFNTIYNLYYKRSFAFAKSYVHDDLAAEDIASESLIKLWETMKREDVSKPPALLLTVLKNKALDYLRHRQVQQDVFDSIADWHQHELGVRISTLQACDPEEIFSNEISRIMQQTLANLPKQTRQIFEMSRYEQLSGKEIAERIGISVKGVDYHIAKALKRLRVSLKDYLPLLAFLMHN